MYKVRLYFVLSSLMVRKLLIETIFEGKIFLEHDILALVNVGAREDLGRVRERFVRGLALIMSACSQAIPESRALAEREVY